LSLALFCAALLSKTATVTLPAVILLIAWWKGKRLGARALLPLAPMFAAGLGLGLLTLWLETTRGGASGALWDLTWIERTLVAGRALWFYAGKLAWPSSLSFNYERWTIDATVWWQFLYPLAAVAVIASLYAVRNKIGRGPLTGVLYFAGTLAPTLGFLNVYFFRYSYVADHFQYLACIGLIAPVTAIVVRQWRPDAWRKLTGTVLGILLLATFGILTWRQSRNYENLEVLCRDTLEKNPASWLATNNLGNLLMKRGHLEGAIEYFENAVEIAPTYVETRLNLAIAMMNSDRFPEAIHHARTAIELQPQNKLGYNALGGALLRAGRPEDAISWLGEAVRRDSRFVKARIDLGTALTQAGRPEEAVGHFEEVLRDRPDNLTAHTNLAIALAHLSRFEEAIRHLQHALRLDPDNPALLQNLSLAMEKANEASGLEEPGTP
jgi:Flp pilus assembly protein TadD